MGAMQYQVGGSLQSQAPSYISRTADQALYDALVRGEFCYVLNARQMGKSSLLVQTRDRLTQAGYRCATVDLTNIGSDNITPLQWYKGIVKDLWRGFKLMRQVPINDWWKEEADISLLQRLSYFIGDVLLEQFPDQDLVIFIDEVDSILSLPFSADDFFALIRFCYNQRATNPAYNRIRFAIFGVAAPADLIRDRSRTPFNLGTAIELQGFTASEAVPLADGLEVQGGDREAVLRSILHWTGGQPFLTQRLCRLAIDAVQSGQLLVMPGNESHWVEQIVQSSVLTEWESQDEPEHLRTIRNRLLSDPETVGRLLSVYQQVLLGQTVTSNDSREQVELLLSGLVIKQGGLLRVRNPIYERIFNSTWVEQQLSELRPYAEALKVWQASGQIDESRLLRGQALKDAQTWALGKRLSDEDYKFLAASVESDRQASQQAAEAVRVQQQLVQEQRAAKLQRRFTAGLGAALLLSVSLGALTLWQFRKTQLGEIDAIATAAEGHFESHHQLTALREIVTAQSKLAGVPLAPAALGEEVRRTLRRILDGSQAKNQLNFATEVQTLSIHPRGDLMAVVTSDGRLSFWHPDGRPATTQLPLAELDGQIGQAVFSPDGQQIAISSTRQDLQLWDLNGQLLKTFDDLPRSAKWQFLPDGQHLLVRLEEGLERLNLSNGERQPLPADQQTSATAVGADGGLIASAYRLPPPGSARGQSFDINTPTIRSIGLRQDKAPGRSSPGRSANRPARADQSKYRPNLRLWHGNGEPLDTLITMGGPIFAVAVNPQSDLIATAHVDSEVRLTRPNGELAQELYGLRTKINRLAFSPDGQLLAVGDVDGGIHLWQVGGGLIQSFLGHNGKLSQLEFSPNGDWLASASRDSTLRLWDVTHSYRQILAGHTDMVTGLYYSADGQQIHSFGVDQRRQVWQRQNNGEFAQTSVDSQIFTTGRVILPSRDRQTIMRVMPNRGPIIGDSDGENTVLFQNIQTGRNGTFALSPSGDRALMSLENQGVALAERNGEGRFDEETQTILPGASSITALAWTPNEETVVSGGRGGGAALWFGLDEQRQQPMVDETTESGQAHDAEVSVIQVSPDGRWIATGSKDKSIKIWTAEGKLVQRFTGHRAGIRALAFSPNSRRLASVAPDGTLMLWQVGQLVAGESPLLRRLTGHRGEINAVAFSPDGLEVATAGSDRRVMVWQVQEILALDELGAACDRVGDYLRNSPDVEEEARSLCN